MALPNELLRYTEYRQRFTELSEREKLIGNLETLQQTRGQMAAKTRELSNLVEEVQHSLANARALRVRLNRTAIEFGRALISPRKPEG